MACYRFVCDGVGIYEAVERDCPRTDPRRENKPDGSWLPRVGMDYPGAVSFWTEVGLARYRASGLMQWHVSIVKGAVEVLVCEEVRKALYRDEYQIIAEHAMFSPFRRIPLNDLFDRSK